MEGWDQGELIIKWDEGKSPTKTLLYVRHTYDRGGLVECRLEKDEAGIGWEASVTWYDQGQKGRDVRRREPIRFSTPEVAAAWCERQLQAGPSVAEAHR